MSERHVLYPGSFDPVTLGHMDILQRALALFDRVTVAVASRGKADFLPVQDRVAMLTEAIGGDARCRVIAFQGLLVDEVRRQKVCAVVRGIRTWMDYEHEWSLAGVNRRLAPDSEYVYLLARPDLAAISSTLVRDVARHGGPIEELVPPNVAAAIRRRNSR
jgi:pantetheine-phosphate adenylyltransferase